MRFLPGANSLVMEICRQRLTLTALPPVDPKLVKGYMQHLNDLKQRSQMRTAQRGRKSK